MSPEQPVSPGAPAPDDVPALTLDLTSVPVPGVGPVVGETGGAPSFLVVAGDDEAGVCVDGVCALP